MDSLASNALHAPDSPRADLPPAANQPREWRLPLIIGVIVALAAAVAVGVYLLMPSRVRVPDLRGATLTGATARLQALHLVVGRKTTIGDPATATLVVAQFPSATTMLTTGSSVDLVLSPAVQVPSLVGTSMRVARRQLANSGLQMGGIQWDSRSRVARNTVLNQFPPAGTKLQSGASVNLVVSGVPERGYLAARPAPESANTQGHGTNISGSWRDAGGAVVRISQNGTTVRYTAHSSFGNCQGNGSITGANFQTSYNCASVIGARSSGRCAGAVSSTGTMFRLNCIDSVMGRTSDAFTR